MSELPAANWRTLEDYRDYLNLYHMENGQLGAIDLRPESNSFTRKLSDYHHTLKRSADPDSLELPDPLKEQERQRIERHQARLGIVGNNLAELQNPEQRSGFESPKKQRQESYKIQKAIRKHGLAYKNVHHCGIFGVDNDHITISRNTEHGSCSCSGVKTCGSVWACPVCRRKILSRRADQIKEMSSYWSNQGNHLYLLTFTVPHTFKDSLAKIYGSSNQGTGLAGALSKWRSWYAFSKKFKSHIGYFGDIRTVEVTHGQNGWHCHVHMLILCERQMIGQDAWQQQLLEKWQLACTKSGLDQPTERGFDIEYIGNREAGQFSAYIAKWGAPGEIASPYAKGAKNGNLTIAELEKCLIDDFYRSWKGISLQKAAKLLSIYYLSMKGQKMMQVGGCKAGHSWKEDLLEQIQARDEDVAEQEEFPAVDLAAIDQQAFQQVARRGLTFRLLDFAERSGYAGILEFMKSQGFPGSVSRPVSLKHLLDRTSQLNWPGMHKKPPD